MIFVSNDFLLGLEMDDEREIMTWLEEEAEDQKIEFGAIISAYFKAGDELDERR